jgi:drug/metabolite transporter (DMT)-like permease
VFTAYAIGSQSVYPVPHQWRQLGAAVVIVTAVYLVVTGTGVSGTGALLLKVAALAVALLAIAGSGLLRGLPSPR